VQAASLRFNTLKHIASQVASVSNCSSMEIMHVERIRPADLFQCEALDLPLSTFGHLKFGAISSPFLRGRGGDRLGVNVVSIGGFEVMRSSTH
jgi:hypothetical protein